MVPDVGVPKDAAYFDFWRAVVIGAAASQIVNTVLLYLIWRKK